MIELHHELSRFLLRGTCAAVVKSHAPFRRAVICAVPGQTAQAFIVVIVKTVERVSDMDGSRCWGGSRMNKRGGRSLNLPVQFHLPPEQPQPPRSCGSPFPRHARCARRVGGAGGIVGIIYVNGRCRRRRFPGGRTLLRSGSADSTTPRGHQLRTPPCGPRMVGMTHRRSWRRANLLWDHLRCGMIRRGNSESGTMT
jgi:hypothetical protein